MERVVTPGGDLLILDDLLTPCAGIPKSIAFTIYMKVATNSASWLYYILLILGMKNQGSSSVKQGHF